MAIKICLAGLTASGKTTLGEALAKSLNIEHVSKSFKQEAKTDKELIEMQHTVSKGYEVDFDKTQQNLTRNKDCVVTTWLGAWNIKDATIRVWLGASLESRIRRLSKEKHKTAGEVEKYIREKDSTNIERWKKIYKIDYLNDHSIFDLELNTENLTIEEMIAIISMLVLSRTKKTF